MNVWRLLDKPIKKVDKKEKDVTDERITLLRIKVLNEKLTKPSPLRIWTKLEFTHFTKIIGDFGWDKQADCSEWLCHKNCPTIDGAPSENGCDYKTSWQA